MNKKKKAETNWDNSHSKVETSTLKLFLLFVL